MTVLQNRAFLEQASEAVLTAWLQRAVATGNFHPLVLGAEPATELQLAHYVALLSIDTQTRFKEAVVRCIIEWSPLGANDCTLQSFAQLAAYTRASQAVDAIHSLVSTHDRWEPQTLAELISVIVGFAPLSAAADFLERLFYSEQYTRYAGKLFIGLCECDRAGFWQHVGRLMQALEGGKVDTPPDLLALAIVDTLGIPQVAKGYRSIEKSDQHRFLALLTSENGPCQDFHKPNGEYWLKTSPKYRSALQQQEYCLARNDATLEQSTLFDFRAQQMEQSPSPAAYLRSRLRRD